MPVQNPHACADFRNKTLKRAIERSVSFSLPCLRQRDMMVPFESVVTFLFQEIVGLNWVSHSFGHTKRERREILALL